MAATNTESGRGFDAVAESRRWKEAVATHTASLNTLERMAWFRSQSSVAAIRDRTQATHDEVLLHEPSGFPSEKLMRNFLLFEP